MGIHHRGALDLSSFDGALVPDDQSGIAMIDLTRVTFIDAYGLVGLACCIAAAAGEGLSVQLRLPVSEELQTYLARMHLGEIIDRYEVESDGSLPEIRELDRRDRLIELQSFRDVHGSDRLAAFIWDRLVGRADNAVVTQLFEATGELGLNVVEHAGSPAGGFVAPLNGQGLASVVEGVRALGGTVRIAPAEPAGASADGRPRQTTCCYPCRVRWWERGCRADQAGDPSGRGRGLPMTLTAPELVSSRDQARKLTADLPPDLSGVAVMVDCSALQASTPSFVDELIKVVLVERVAARLVLQSAPDRTVELARRAADNHRVAERLLVRQ